MWYITTDVKAQARVASQCHRQCGRSCGQSPGCYRLIVHVLGKRCKKLGPAPSSSSLGPFWETLWLTGLHQRKKMAIPRRLRTKSGGRCELLQEAA